jgi:UDP-N-acetyl-D-glucosamine/UDP-N-acetyl-D-galactosamine dehydrogenase
MTRKIAIIGLGYAGLHTALAFSKQKKVIGYDINKKRIEELRQHIDTHGDFTKEDFLSSQIEYIDHPDQLKEADFYIIVVPTPINSAKEPDFEPLIEASNLVGKYLKPKDIVVYESTVYPGATEEICLPILEKISGLSLHKDFSLGYSPERINPGDKIHHFENTVKIVSGSDAKTLDIIATEYAHAIQTDIYRVSNIKTAEAAKIIENSQRDVNIAFINEMAMLLHKLDLDPTEVLNAALTKWNFLPFRPGFVGGHCISVDPYYLIHKAQELNFYQNLIPAARKVNDGVANFIADESIKFILNHHPLNKNSEIGLLGITYKENCPDIRNSLVVSLIKELETYGMKVKVHDPLADPHLVQHEYGISLVNWDDLSNLAAVLIAVAHDEFKQISPQQYKDKLNNHGVIIDVKSILPIEKFKAEGIPIWRF